VTELGVVVAMAGGSFKEGEPTLGAICPDGFVAEPVHEVGYGAIGLNQAVIEAVQLSDNSQGPPAIEHPIVGCGDGEFTSHTHLGMGVAFH